MKIRLRRSTFLISTENRQIVYQISIIMCYYFLLLLFSEIFACFWSSKTSKPVKKNCKNDNYRMHNGCPKCNTVLENNMFPKNYDHNNLVI